MYNCQANIYSHCYYGCSGEVYMLDYPLYQSLATQGQVRRCIGICLDMENQNMQNYALNLVNFGAHLSKILKYDIPWWNSPII